MRFAVSTTSLKGIGCSALILLGVSACERIDRTASDSDSPPSATAPEPAPPVAETVLTSTGLGPVRIGMSLAEVTTLWGQDDNPAAVGGPEPEVCDQFHPEKAPQGVQVMIQQGRLVRITLMRGATIRTDRGFGLGDAGAAVREAYGGSIYEQPHKYLAAPAADLFAWSSGGTTRYVVDPTARGIRYEIGTDGKVTLIHAGGPEIQLVEGCS